MSAMILDATSCMVLVIEAETGVVVEMNQPAETLTGFSREQIVGLRLWDLASPDQRERVHRSFVEAQDGVSPLATRRR